MQCFALFMLFLKHSKTCSRKPTIKGLSVIYFCCLVMERFCTSQNPKTVNLASPTLFFERASRIYVDLVAVDSVTPHHGNKWRVLCKNYLLLTLPKHRQSLEKVRSWIFAMASKLLLVVAFLATVLYVKADSRVVCYYDSRAYSREGNPLYLLIKIYDIHHQLHRVGHACSIRDSFVSNYAKPTRSFAFKLFKAAALGRDQNTKKLIITSLFNSLCLQF